MSVFREYDIRGIADRDLPDAFAWALGKTVGALAKKNGESRIYVGRDVRISSPRLTAALCAGLETNGLEVRKLAPGPTPLLYFAAYEAETDFPTKSGLMVTASHNPGEYNGFKMVIAGKTIYGDAIRALEAEVRAAQSQAPATYQPRAREVDRSKDYIAFVQKRIKLGSKKLKVVLDGGNGAGGPLGIATYEALGVNVVPIFCEPDGTFPNHHPDPTVPENLQDLIKKVRDVGADVGIAYDGDADRIGAVTSTGRILFGDHLVLFFSRQLLNEVPGATIISEVKSSQVLYDTLAKWGAKPVIWKTGHSLIKAKLRETGAALAGEMSGHMFFNHGFPGFDDALFAGAKLIEGLSNSATNLDDFLSSLPAMTNTPELRVDCPDEIKFQIVTQFVEAAKKQFPAGDILDIDGARVKLHGGWGLVRASNTGPILVMRFEGPDRAALKKIRDTFSDILAKIDTRVKVPVIA